MKKTINIACGSSDLYAPMCGIMLTSLFENNRDCHVEVYILTSGFGRKNEYLMNQLVEHGHYDGCVHIIKVDDTRLENCPLLYWSIEGYYSMLLSEILPTNVDKVLWLECDILVNGSILPLFETDINDVAIAGNDDICLYSKYSDDDFYKWLGYPKKYGHFNAGVMLFNLTYFREHHITESLFKYLEDNYNRIKFAAEEVLNVVLRDQKETFPNKYNVVDLALLKEVFDETKKEIFLSERPVIVHYTVKPWSWYWPDYPFKAQWEAARKKSLWSSWESTKPLKLRLHHKLVMSIKKLLRRKTRYYVDDWKVWA